MNQVLNECHAARTARREDGYARPRLLSQFRGELEENGEDGLGLPRRPTEAELDALEAKYRTEMPQVVSEPLGLPMESSAWQLADGTVVSDVDPYADWEARARGEGVEALAAARAARAAAEEDAPLSPAGSLPSPVGRPDSDLGRAIDAAIRDADEALAAIGADAVLERRPVEPSKLWWRCRVTWVRVMCTCAPYWKTPSGAGKSVASSALACYATRGRCHGRTRRVSYPKSPPLDIRTG
mmetsp:Transcript_14180/g.41800  ORF Transcript_14180/g.41800 Transcript_14180/m.41800 type:complete len:240 (-) Transcript_14180:2191-2910(-)